MSPITPWKISAKVKADPAAAKLDQLDVSYGAEERALRFSGLGDVSFGASPLLHAVLSARQLDADRFAAKDSKDTSASEPLRVVPGLRALIAGIPQSPIPTQIEFSAEQIMLGGRPVQNLAAEFTSDTRLLEHPAAGSSRARRDAGVPDRRQCAGSSVGLSPARSASNPPIRMHWLAWLQGRGEVTYRSQKPLRLRGNVSVAAGGFAIEAMKAEIDGGAVEGRMALSNLPAGGGSRFDAELKGERLDLDAAAALTRSLAGPPGDWPEEAQLSLDIGRAVSAGQELRPFMAKLGYGPKFFSLDRLKIGQPDSVTLEGSGNFDRASLTGKLALEFDAGVAAQLTALDRAVCTVACLPAQCAGNRSGARAHQAGARSRQGQDTGRSRPRRFRLARSRCAAAQGHRDAHRDARIVGAGRDRSRCAQAHRVQP